MHTSLVFGKKRSLVFCRAIICSSVLLFSTTAFHATTTSATPPTGSVKTVFPNGGEPGPKPIKRGSALISWFNDDDKKKIPLVLIHGIHESDDLSVITNKGPSWRAFLAKFSADDYLRRTYTVYAFQYYSDQDGVQDLAKQLGVAIDNTFRDRPHVLLAHSMGGLIAKSYMTEYSHASGKWSGTSGGDTTLLLITLATPHHGTPGANDASALQQYMGTGWSQVFSTVNFLYWTDRAGWLSLPVLNSGNYNRSDLRWDNYDSALRTDFNIWLGHANGRFAKYSSKVIAYAGALKLVFPNLTAAGALAQIPAVSTTYNDHQRLEFGNESMVYGLQSKFGITDGMVPYYSSLLCDKGPFIGPPDPNFFCLSPTRVRRFEPGSVSVLNPEPNTLSIDRRDRGYDHLDMRDAREVLNWVVKDLVLEPKPVVSTSLKLAPAAGYLVGQSINGTFTVTNRGNKNLFMKRVVIGGRLAGQCPNNQCPDFGPVPGDITVAPGQSYNYAGSFTPALAGSYTFSVAYEDANGKWTMPVDAENASITNKLNINVQAVTARVVVSKSLTVTPNTGPYSLGQTISGSFSVTNRGNTNVVMRQVVIGGRLGDACPNNICPDFSPIGGNITLGPNQTYNYSGQIRLSQPGTYTFYVAYQTPDEKWEMPVRPENGAVNKLSILVQGPTPTLTRAAPSAIAASPVAQTITIYGTRLAKVIYGELKLPNGTSTYLYIPLNQLFRVTDDQTRITTKFPLRGTYYVTVWTAEGRSNQYPITVY